MNLINPSSSLDNANFQNFIEHLGDNNSQGSCNLNTEGAGGLKGNSLSSKMQTYVKPNSTDRSNS
jgi:hypothetical protein